ncbi:MAG: ABC transporter substrate-binding protein, partial [Dehalococcoidia bacterium]|nr:ABC transporter substrate-binding protein [Dehalococcoidia bacterium]
MRLTRGFLLLLSTLLLIAVVACGGEDPTPVPPTATAVPAATEAPAPTVAPAPEVQTVKIGLLSPQTGPIAQYAPGFEDAGKVAISELNAAHSDFQFELIVGDSGCDGTQAATAAQSLIDSGVSAIVGAACSGATLGAIAVAAPAGVPMVSYASTSPAVTTAEDNGHLFRV